MPNIASSSDFQECPQKIDFFYPFSFQNIYVIKFKLTEKLQKEYQNSHVSFTKIPQLLKIYISFILLSIPLCMYI
jgi:hypothetical protein